MRMERTVSITAVALATAALLAGCGKKTANQSGDMSVDTSMEAGAMGQMAPGGLAALMGTHEVSGLALSFDSAGSFTVSQNDSVEVRGHATGNGDTVTFMDDTGGCAGVKGDYVVTSGSTGPQFTLVSDTCKPRMQALVGDSTGMAGGQ